MEVREPGIRHAIGAEKHSRNPPLRLVFLVSKSSFQQSPLGEAHLQGLRAEVLVERLDWISLKPGAMVGKPEHQSPDPSRHYHSCSVTRSGSSYTVSPFY